jgi:hypothetical protein
MIVRTPRHHTSAAIGGMPAESCLLAAASDCGKVPQNYGVFKSIQITKVSNNNQII